MEKTEAKFLLLVNGGGRNKLYIPIIADEMSDAVRGATDLALNPLTDFEKAETLVVVQVEASSILDTITLGSMKRAQAVRRKRAELEELENEADG
jgi:hypothetical protein